MSILVTDIEWEPQDQMISEEEFEALLEETPREVEVEVDSEDEFESDPASYLDTDELKAKRFEWSAVA